MMHYKYTEINGKAYFNWVKRIRQAHLATEGSTTLCKMPMLGSNYNSAYPRDTWKTCEKCYSIAKGVAE